MPAGIVYQVGSSLYITNDHAPPLKLYEGEGVVWYSLSHDGRLLTYREWSRESAQQSQQFLVDLTSGAEWIIAGSDNGNFCPFVFIPSTSNYMFSMLLPEGWDPGYSCEGGSPSVYDVMHDTTFILDESLSSLGRFAVSPNGKTVAYDEGGLPKLFSIQDGEINLEPFESGLAPAGHIQFFNPKWSPTGSKIAWAIYSDNSELEGFVILDLVEKVSLVIEPYKVRRWEVCSGKVEWSSDEQYLLLSHCEYDYCDVVSSTGELIRSYGMDCDITWAPDGNRYAAALHDEQTSTRVLEIRSATSDAKTIVGPGDHPIWGPNGEFILYNSDGGYYLLNLNDMNSERINFPPSARIQAWYQK